MSTEIKPDFAKQMSESPLVKVTKDTVLRHGQLFGFMGLGEERGITAAYQVWRKNGTEVQFVLFISSQTGRPCIDNDWIREDGSCMYTNVEPIIVPIDLSKSPETFQDSIKAFFNGK